MFFSCQRIMTSIDALRENMQDVYKNQSVVKPSLESSGGLAKKGKMPHFAKMIRNIRAAVNTNINNRSSSSAVVSQFCKDRRLYVTRGTFHLFLFAGRLQ